MINEFWSNYLFLLFVVLFLNVTQSAPPLWANRRWNRNRGHYASSDISIEADISIGSLGTEIRIQPSYEEETHPGHGPPVRPPGRGHGPPIRPPGRGNGPPIRPPGRGHGRGPWKPWKRGRPEPLAPHYDESIDEYPVPHERPVPPHPTPGSFDENRYTTNKYDIDEICGITHNSRIVGGVDAHPNKWIWMAALIKSEEKESYCGGSLITKKHVLTAAHCVDNVVPKDMFVRLGSYDFSNNADESSEDIKVKNFHIHPEYDKRSYANDIAIITLEKEASFSDLVRPICLPPQRRSFFGRLATVIGWGYSEYASGQRASKLREVTVPVWNDTQCEEAYKREFKERAFCAGFQEGGKDSCQGDSGGPLMIQTSQRKWCVIGIVSFGQNCGSPGFPGVYTKVSEYKPWIYSSIRE